MRHEFVSKPVALGIDWKGLGYLTSIVSVLFLGAVAWPGPDEPRWQVAALIAGMATSILGMAFRYKSHLDQKRQMRNTREKAESRR